MNLEMSVLAGRDAASSCRLRQCLLIEIPGSGPGTTVFFEIGFIGRTVIIVLYQYDVCVENILGLFSMDGVRNPDSAMI